jgi:penicillin-binding protein 2
VEVDLSTLPPVPGLVREGKKQITVDGVAYHVLGSMKESAQKEDSDRRRSSLSDDPAFAARVRTPADMPGLIKPLDRGEYQDDDPAGKSGVEASREEVLRGLRGLNVQQLDTGDERKLPPERGRDVQLTIDINLQARVQAAMSPELGLAVAQEWHGHENPTVPLGTPLNGAAVVLEVDSGDIIALVSTPSISRAMLQDHPDEIFEDPLNKAANVPWLDRAIARPYPPGSIAKAIILNGAVKLGKHSLDSHIDCNGHLFPDKPNMFRCWIYKMTNGVSTHTGTLGHALSAPEALMVSCNIYFFTMGQKLGPVDITNTYAMFGLGQPWNLGVGVEYPGEIGERLPGGGKKPLAIQDAIQMGIGQGPVAWTPLHAADAFATLARGGVRIRPHVINEPSSVETEDIGLDKRAVKEALQGLWNSTNEDPGSGHHLTINERHVPHFNAPGVVVWGKTGTATAPDDQGFADHHESQDGQGVCKSPLGQGHRGIRDR